VAVPLIELALSKHDAGVTPSPAPIVAPRSPAQQARLARMIERDYRLIWRLLRRLGLPPEQADDAAQQVFLIAAERLADIREESERSFAFGTALRVAQSQRRRTARAPAPIDDGLHVSPLPDPEQLTDQRRARERLDAALAALPLELRTTFVLFELEGLTSPEIAELAGIPLGTVASRLRRAREQFREQVMARAPTSRRERT
jgi:RNA polymerase sigma-70 factor, ECF subfamily